MERWLLTSFHLPRPSTLSLYLPRRSPQQAALHCIMHVLDPSTLEMIYQPAIIRFALLKSGPSALMGGEVGERDTIMLCTVDPAMAFECVFTERLEAAQLLNYLQVGEFMCLSLSLER